MAQFFQVHPVNPQPRLIRQAATILREGGAALVATDVDDADEPPLRRIGAFLYLRLRRTVLTDTDVTAWSERLRPFVDDGMDTYVFFRHDHDGASAVRAELLQRLLGRPGHDQ